MTEVKIKLLRPGARVPERKTAGAAGFDLSLATERPFVLFPNEPVVLPLGFAVEVPHGWEAQIRSRSGLATHGVTIANSPGTIDSDYRGEVSAILINTSHRMHTLRPGDRVGQMVFQRLPEVRLVEVDELSDTDRGERGYGSTGR